MKILVINGSPKRDKSDTMFQPSEISHDLWLWFSQCVTWKSENKSDDIF